MNERVKTCRLCGVEFATRSRDALYCSPDHRKLAWNIQATRGKSLYNVYMLTRFERGLAADAGIGLAQVNRLVSHWHLQDQGRNHGKTWAPLQAIRDDVGHLMFSVRGRI